MPDDAMTGFIFEAVLEYTAHLHAEHSDYSLPSCPNHLHILHGMHLPHSCQVWHAFTGKTEYNSWKLASNLYNKNHYTVHYKNLKLYLDAGMRITKVHKVLSFTQSIWLKSMALKNFLERFTETVQYGRVWQNDGKPAKSCTNQNRYRA